MQRAQQAAETPQCRFAVAAGSHGSSESGCAQPFHRLQLHFRFVSLSPLLLKNAWSSPSWRVHAAAAQKAQEWNLNLGTEVETAALLAVSRLQASGDLASFALSVCLCMYLPAGEWHRLTWDRRSKLEIWLQAADEMAGLPQVRHTAEDRIRYACLAAPVLFTDSCNASPSCLS